MLEKLNQFISSKKLVSIVLIPILIGICVISFLTWFNGMIIMHILNVMYNEVFYNTFFSILIIADVFILLLSFLYTERYSQIMRNTGFIICTILIRLSFSSTGITGILLIISGIVFGLERFTPVPFIEKKQYVNNSFYDDFSSNTLDLQWNFRRVPRKNTYVLDSKNKKLKLNLSPETFKLRGQYSLMGFRQKETEFEYSASSFQTTLTMELKKSPLEH